MKALDRNKLFILFTKLLPDSFYIKIRYFIHFKKRLNLKTPITFNEKLQWLKLYDQTPVRSLVSDKFKVRQFVSKRLNTTECLTNIYQIASNPYDIDFKALPDKFVIKMNFGSGMNIIVRDKKELNINDTVQKLKSWLNYDYYYLGREHNYNLDKKIIIEEYLGSGSEVPADYKFFVFNGVVEIIQVDVDRFNGHKRNIYSPDWNLIDVRYVFPNVKSYIDKPSKLSIMLDFASRLGMGVPFYRVDFFQVGEKVYFGEITNFPESGFGKFSDPEFDKMLGEKLDIVSLIAKKG